MKQKRYNNYLLEDFLLDEDFKSWVQGNDKRLDYFWQKWMDSHPEKVKTVLTARQILLSMQFKTITVHEDEHGETLQNIIQGQHSKYGTSVSGNRFIHFKNQNRSKLWLSIAAAVSILLIAGISLFVLEYSANELSIAHSTTIQKSTVSGQKLTHTLPDGTKVILNSETEISYYDDFNAKRKVELQGEAFFEVVEDKSRPFTVISGNTATQVLGTSFNVKAFPENDETKISLLLGKVRVYSRDVDDHDWEVLLQPGERVTINHSTGEIVQSRYDFVKEMGWKENILVFDNSDHQSVIKKLERWYGVKIKAINNPPKRWEIKGHFNNASLEEVLKSLQYTNQIDFKIENKNVEIKF